MNIRKFLCAFCLLAFGAFGGAAQAQVIGNPLVDADDSSGNAGDIIFDETTALVTAPGFITSWSFYDDDNLAPNVVITPLILRFVAAGQYEITGIGQSRTSTEAGIQTYPFNLQSGSAAVAADGTYYFGFRNANPDGSLSHVGGVDVTFSGNGSFYSESNNNATPVGSVIPMTAFAATYSYSATISASAEGTTSSVPTMPAIALALTILGLLLSGAITLVKTRKFNHR